jgi:hypothetical protein
VENGVKDDSKVFGLSSLKNKVAIDRDGKALWEEWIRGRIKSTACTCQILFNNSILWEDFSEWSLC